MFVYAALLLLAPGFLYKVKNTPAVKSKDVVAIIGDVGGTNLRLKLIRLNLATNESVVLKELTKFKAIEFDSMADGIVKFLEDF